MRIPKMPEKVWELLNRHEINENDILAGAKTDMNTACEYADGFVVLTKKKLFIASSPAVPSAIHVFKGYPQVELRDALQEWTMVVYSVEELSEVKIERQVACAVLTAQVNGTERILAAFSNLCMKHAYELVRRFQNLDKDSEEEEQEEEEFCPKCGTMYPDQSRKICPKCMDRKSVFFRTFAYFKPYTAAMIWLLVCIVMTAVLNLVWPYLSGTVLYDYVLEKNLTFLEPLGIEKVEAFTALTLLVIVMFLTKLILQLFQIAHGVITAKVVVNVVRDMKKDVFRQMGKLSIQFFKSRQTGSLMTRVLSDADRVTGFFVDVMPYVFVHGFTIIATLIVMFMMSWQLALAAVAMMPITLIISMKLRPKLWGLFGRRHRKERTVNSNVNDNLTGARVVKAFGQQENEIVRFEKGNRKLSEAEIDIVKYDNKFTAIFSAARELINIIVWILGVLFVLGTDYFEVGMLLTFTGYVGQLNGPINFFSRFFYNWSDSMNSAQRMFEILDSIPEITEQEQAVRLPEPKGEIVLDHVTFGYELSKPILKDITLHIKPGEMLGIVGRSGAGKTTLVNLISRMYDPQEGQIYIDGVNVRDMAFYDLRRNVAMVSQETYIFMGTVEQNIAYANPTATKEEIIQAAVLASAHEFILRMPDGYDTVIGSSGRQLSGGERQRISIARAILANPKILILDEATASVDTETEKAIQTSMQYLVKDRTTLSIAHRLSTLRDADRLIVIDNGKITEEGTHAELEELHGTYYKLMELQTKALAMKGLE
ncbi:MAG: ATP-binding cassette domain-containing protein [Lachnospiraceae bacterium]|nr:ATP-binding cassette domain-containing protein [Lachnospiraceae bacterium]